MAVLTVKCSTLELALLQSPDHYLEYWNTLPDCLRDLILFTDTFKRYLKHFLFALYYSALETFCTSPLLLIGIVLVLYCTRSCVSTSCVSKRT